MRTLSEAVRCPRCGHVAVITLREDADPAARSEGHSVELNCPTGHAELETPELLLLWTADRRGASTSRREQCGST